MQSHLGKAEFVYVVGVVFNPRRALIRVEDGSDKKARPLSRFRARRSQGYTNNISPSYVVGSGVFGMKQSPENLAMTRILYICLCMHVAEVVFSSNKTSSQTSQN